jgi:hypothetical protein
MAKRNKNRTPPAPKKRNMVAYAMMMRHSRGAGAGVHSRRGYTRKVKHKVKPSW